MEFTHPTIVNQHDCDVMQYIIFFPDLPSSLTLSADYSASDLVTSRGLPIRDPDTGALYVQTQLLQV